MSAGPSARLADSALGTCNQHLGTDLRWWCGRTRRPAEKKGETHDHRRDTPRPRKRSEGIAGSGRHRVQRCSQGSRRRPVPRRPKRPSWGRANEIRSTRPRSGPQPADTALLRAHAKEKITDIDAKIADLRTMRADLDSKITCLTTSREALAHSLDGARRPISEKPPVAASANYEPGR